ncbi:hypothetical protein ACVW0P_002118 [Mucilaginibacter sp. UYNi724]
MKKGNLIIYWLATALLCFGMLGSGVSQVMRVKDMVALLTPLGYPVYFMTIIGVWKILAVIAILMPGFKLIKEWAYAGLFFVMTGALLSHIAVGDVGFKALVGPVMQIVFIILSWYFRPASREIILTDQ